MLGTGFRKHVVPRFVSAVALALVSLAVWTRAEDPLPTNPDYPVITCPDTVPIGQGLYGSATDDDPPLVVNAKYNGVHLGGSPDTTQSGNVNSFCFDTYGVPAGGWIVITAVDGEGRMSLKFVKVTH